MAASQTTKKAIKSDTVSTKEWVLTIFISLIPVVGLIAILVWSFLGNTKDSKQNWARAMIIWSIMGILLTAVALGLLYSLYDVLLADLRALGE